MPMNRFLSAVCLTALLASNLHAQDATTSKTDEPRETRLADYLNQSKFIGSFTVDGREAGKLKPETYVISKCEKLPAKDMYRMTAKIVYGDVDSEVPLDLKIVWAENTPVITIDSMWIPGMGTFSSRVMIHKDHYAGTWTHDEKGGHLFGKIEQINSAPESSEDTP